MKEINTFKRFWWTLPILGVALAVMLIGLPAMTTNGADHMDAPLSSIDSRADINDVYVFTSPENTNNTVLIMTVNPLAGVSNPTTFSSDADYDFLIDTNGDGIKDLKYRFKFSDPRKNGEQVMNIRGPGANVRARTQAQVNLPNGGKAMAGVFDDPFFFDLNGFKDNMNFTGDDFFAGLNVSAIVLELPNSVFNSFVIGTWARTKVNGRQVDRMGRPLVNTLLIPDGSKDDYNAGNPRSDFLNWGDTVVSDLVAGGKDPSDASNVARNSFPDVLFSFLGTPTNYPNGRKLQDDVGNAALADLPVFNPDDGADFNDVAFSSSFPYVGSPHQPSP